jgi:hypothetical protein
MKSHKEVLIAEVANFGGGPKPLTQLFEIFIAFFSR